MKNAVGLGIDAGGTATRWALSSATGEIIAEGAVAALSGLQMAHAEGRRGAAQTLATLAEATRAHAAPLQVVAGVTGFDENDPALAQLIATAFAIELNAVKVANDLETTCRAFFAPGAGYVVYAGTGSIAAYIDANNVFHRAGGRGVLLDDGGGGYWIAREALRAVWRREDEEPGAWRASPLATALFTRIGGETWLHSRNFFYHASRGEIGMLAVVVAEVADQDPLAHTILSEAGRELARLARAMLNRFGTRPLVVTGRAASLHPIIGSTLVDALPAGSTLHFHQLDTHQAAARIAAGARPATLIF